MIYFILGIYIDKIDNVDKCLLGGCPGSGKEAASLALLVRISDKKKYTNNLYGLHALFLFFAHHL